MKKRLLVVLLIILLTLAYTIASTYAVIINVKSDNGINEIINKITIKELLTKDNNEYNETYYNVKNTLDVTEEDMDILMNSKELDKKLQIVLNKIVDYKVNKNENSLLTSDEIYNMIKEATESDNTIPYYLKRKVIENSKIYSNDINEFLYDLEVSVKEN